MSHIFHQLYYHFAWGTHNRQPVIERAQWPELLRIQAEEVAKRGGILIRHNTLADHAHLLVRLTPNILVSDFIGQVKGGVSYRFNREAKPHIHLSWQEGYGVVTIREGDVSKVSRYIDRQEELHERRKLSKVLEILQMD
jgi:REP element-mobilizing transposase RayT